MESFYLQKPYLELPMHGQFEQEINGYLLSRLGYGIDLRRVNATAIGNFLYRIPDYKQRLENYAAEDNSRIKSRLAELLDNDCALAREYHHRRTRVIP
jgi:hypothetical protein